MDDVGARSLMAAILTQAYKDCQLKPTTKDKIREIYKAKKWLSHPFCKELCESIDIDYKRYKEACLADEAVKLCNKGAGR